MISKFIRSGLLISLTLFWVSSKAQISYGGEPLFKNGKLKSELSTIYLPRFKMSTMSKAYEQVEGKSYLKHAQYAYRYTTSYNALNSGKWQVLDDGRRVWRISISSPGAYSLGLIFSKFRIPTGSQMFVYNKQSNRILGAYNEKNNKESGRFSVEPLQGDEITVEYIEPLHPDFIADIEIGSVLHDYKNIFNQLQGTESRLKSSGTCNVNINCPQGDEWQVEKQSVCHILYSGYIASGALINNTRFDGRPFLLTAHHAVNSQEDADVAIFYFNYEAVDCSSDTGSKSQSISGSSLLATTSRLDFTLLELSVMPPASYSPYYTGWDRSGRVPTNTTCIHHPQGDVKKISADYDAPLTDSYSDKKYTFDTNTHWLILEWDLGTTEGGSSGSPLFDENHRLIGDLTGGEANCDNPVYDYFAKFSESWANYSEANQQLKFWLDPLNLGVETLDGVDPYKGLRAVITASQDSICYESQVTFTDISLGEPDEFYWNFGDGATPQTSIEKGPHVVSYSNPGRKQVKLIVRRNGVADSVVRSILAMDVPVANFDYTVDLNKVQMTNTSVEGMTYNWNFGDGTVSEEENPSHTYARTGRYTINLSTENLCGVNSTSKEITTTYNDLVRIYPNPSDGVFTVDLSQIVYLRTTWMVFDTKGAQIRSGVVSSYESMINFNLNGLSSGVYILNLNIDGVDLKRKLLLTN
ncbi:PKD domain-containing protein [Labilibaculum sp. K2S]|uniref:T9SS type A sorting domain-containing protein n=1 Tax=Labilibaculum sp. K2S TaxID=3056386 RepID=UPI0025A3883C|nr:PKD domain-containing protein [Labilibaculum sp. K2S]MDM8158366.1 PKD domain-containing protein [Labilibaculum sp. K2S]